MSTSRSRIAIVGAGPIGLEAALFASQQGFEVTVLERGRVADNVRAWGHVRLFSPFAMNVSPWGRAALEESGYEKMPADDALLTGFEFAEQYLIPLSQHPQLAGVVREETEVTAIGRADCWKGDLIGAARQNSPFRILVRSHDGEDLVESDFVLDCSGTYPNHNWLGAGGIPCPGETENQQQLTWTLPDVTGIDRERFQGKRTLVVGSGFSAATTVVALADLAGEASGTSAVWLTRSNRKLPIEELPDDPLTERAELTRRANALAEEQGGVVEWKPASVVRSVEKAADGFCVTIETKSTGDPHQERLPVNEIVAQVGYRPDRSIYEELQVHECYATQGPIKLAAALLGESSNDCLAQACPGPETLTNPEPGFFILGARSYGRTSQFLLRVGIEQIEAVFSLIATHSSKQAYGGSPDFPKLD